MILTLAVSTQNQSQSPTHGATPQQGNRSVQAIVQLFNQYDITETSYHLHTGRIDLHLCDDVAPGMLTHLYHVLVYMCNVPYYV